jgi:hypothetical protein
MAMIAPGHITALLHYEAGLRGAVTKFQNTAGAGERQYFGREQVRRR